MTLRDRMRVLAREEARAWTWAAVILACGLLHVLWQDVQDARWWRDLTRQTPFADVVITSATATALEVTLTGTLVKTRDCVTVGAAVTYVVADGIALPAAFSVGEGAHVPQSRPVIGEPQAWGPWIITSPVAWPERARLYRTHDCGGEMQTNLVFDVAWPRPDAG